MDARPVLLEDIFQGSYSFRIPLYQRSYVWEKENWEHLWRDIEEKASLRIRRDPKSHFTGAIVVQKNSNDQYKLEVIDGQQRLTTFQVIFCVIRYIAKRHPQFKKDDSIFNEAKRRVLHGATEANTADDPDEVYRLLPIADSSDKTAYKNAVNGNVPKTSHRQSELHRIYEAYNYFYERIDEYIDKNVTGQYSKFSNLYSSIVRDFKVVRIILDDPKDEAEKIFESINGRGRTLSDFDHLRNNLFLRAGAERNMLYTTYWSHFDKEPYWNSEQNEQKFMEAFLRAKLGNSYPSDKRRDRVKPNMFDIYQLRYRSSSEDSVIAEFEELKKYSDMWYDLHRNTDAKIYRNIQALAQLFDISEWFPFIMYVCSETDIRDNENDLRLFFLAIESYITRRAICFGRNNLYLYNNHLQFFDQIKSWNKFDVLKFVERMGEIKDNQGNSLWPSDRYVERKFNNTSSTDNLTQRYILYRIALRMQREDPTAAISVGLEQFSLEHIMPRNWERDWQLPETSAGRLWYFDDIFMRKYKVDNPNWVDNPSENGLVESTDGLKGVLNLAKERKALLHSMGNLTIIGRRLNSRLGSTTFERKKRVYEKSALNLNREIAKEESWDVEQIKDRERRIFGYFREIWPQWDALRKETNKGVPPIHITKGDELLRAWRQICLSTYDGEVTLSDVGTDQYYITGKSQGCEQRIHKEDVLFAFPAAVDLHGSGLCRRVRQDLCDKKMRPTRSRLSERKGILRQSKVVEFTVRTGHVLEGRVTAHSRYETLVETNGGDAAIIYLHGLYEIRSCESSCSKFSHRWNGIYFIDAPSWKTNRSFRVRNFSKDVEPEKLKKGAPVTYQLCKDEEGYFADNVDAT